MSDNEMTQEEILEKRQEMTDQYESMLPHLEAQLKYETLLTDIEMQRVKRVQAQVALANMMAPDPEEEEEDLPVRTLKRD